MQVMSRKKQGNKLLMMMGFPRGFQTATFFSLQFTIAKDSRHTWSVFVVVIAAEPPFRQLRSCPREF